MAVGHGLRLVAGRRPRRTVRGGVGDDPAVEHLDLAGQPGRDVAVVGDHDDGRSSALSSSSRSRMALAGGAVEVAGRLVGQHDRRAAHQGAGDRDPLPLAARQLGRPGGAACGRARPVPARAAAVAALGMPAPAYSSPSATLSSAVACSARKNCWNTNPMLVARSPDSSRSDRRGDVQAGDPHRPGRGPVQGAHQVQQRRLARPRRPDDGDQLALGDGEADPAQRRRPAAGSGRSWSPRPAPAPAGIAASAGDADRGRRRAGGAAGCPRSCGRHHHTLAGGKARPGHLDQARGVVEQPRVTATRWCGRRRRPPRPRTRRRPGPAARRPAPPARSATLPVVIVTSTGAWSRLPVAAGSLSVDLHGDRRRAVRPSAGLERGRWPPCRPRRPPRGWWHRRAG